MAGFRSSSRFGLSALASLVVNALLIAVLLTLGVGRRARLTESTALTVMSLAALRGSEQGKERAAISQKTASVPVPQPTRPSVQPTPPLPPLPVPPLPPSLVRPENSSSTPVALAPTSEPVQNPASLSSSSSAAMAQSSSTAVTPAQTRRGVAEGLDADAPAGKSLAYAAKVRSWLYAHKIYPRRARMMREEGVVRVRFVLDRAGVLLEGMIVASSGKASLDEEARAMMHRASPYPHVPATVPGERLQFDVPIEFVLPV